jgi:putative ABC transport system permease protein
MNLFVLVWSNLVARPLNTALNILLLALGLSIVIVLLIVNTQLSEKIARNARGIDLVASAKGSPLQIILCSIFHADYPTGNISLKEAERVAKHPLVKKAIPLALGDSYTNFRIAGTDTSYLKLYRARMAAGRAWELPLEVVLGAQAAAETFLGTGDSFTSAHGLSAEGSAHAEHRLTVVGVLQPSGTVLDNLILTSVETVWAIHQRHEEVADTIPPLQPSRLVKTVEAGDSTKQITSLLVQFRSPLAAVQLPRWINSISRLQAASPAFEIDRLFSLIGAGADVVIGFAYVLIAISALSVFIAIFNSLKERRYELAVMRTLGASRLKLFILILSEGSVLTFIGGLMGMLFGHVAVAVFVSVNAQGKMAGILPWEFTGGEVLVLAGSLVIGIVSSLLPAVHAYRTPISETLAGQ